MPSSCAAVHGKHPSTMETTFEKLLGLLADGEVRFILVGGVAVTLHGYVRLTEDVDILIERTPENVVRLLNTLAEYGEGFAKELSPEDFSDEHKMFAETTDDFVNNEIKPNVDKIEEKNEELSVGLLRKAGELGLLSVDIPEEYDGMGLDKISSVIVAEHVGKTGAWAVTFGGQTGIGSLPVVYFGTPGQKKKYLPKFASAEWVTSYSLSEAGSGSDARVTGR